MSDRFLKVILLAAVADGEIQTEELELINLFRKSHPVLKKINDDKARAAMADIYNKLSAGMEVKHILEQIGETLNQNEKESAFALAKEQVRRILILFQQKQIF